MPSLLLSGILVWAALATQPSEKTPAPSLPVSSKATTTSESNDASVFEEDTPPTTEFDKIQNKDTPTEPRRDLVSQVARTIFALVVVLGLIFLFSKYGLARLTGLRTGVGGKNIHLVERVQLDQKHTLYIVDIEGNGSLLLGGGEGELRLITPLKSDPSPSPNTPFSTTLAQAQPSDLTTSAGKGSKS